MQHRALLLALCLLSLSAQAAPAIVDSIRLPGTPDGQVAGYSWHTPTVLAVDGEHISLQTYTGGVLGEKASGLGRLSFGEPPLPQAVGGGLGNFAAYPDAFGIGLVLRGEFKDGVPVGPGELYSRLNMTSVRAEFSGFMKYDGPAVMTIFGRKAAFASFKDSRPVDGPLKIFLYTPSGAGPTRVFLGQLKDGKQVGTWTALPWRETTAAGEVLGYGPSRLYRAKDSPNVYCTVTGSASNPSAGDMASLTGTMNDVDFVTDPESTATAALCESSNAEGWTYRYRVTQQTVLSSSVTPVDCSDATGYAGTLTVEPDNTLSCRTMKNMRIQSNNVFAKIWREVKRTPDNIVNIIDKVGNESSNLLCDIVHKEKGKNCNVSIRVGTTFDIPESITPTTTDTPPAPDAIKTRTSAAVLERLRVKATENESSKWAQAAAEIYSMCVQFCINTAYRDYSLLRMQDLESIVNSGAPDDVKGRYIASFASDMSDFAETVASTLPVVSYGYRWYMVNKMWSQVFDARMAILDQPYPKDVSKSIAQDAALRKLQDLGLREVLWGQVVPLLMDGWKDAYIVALPDIPGLSSKTQYQLLRMLQIDVDEFAATHRNLKYADEFIAAAIGEIMRQL